MRKIIFKAKRLDENCKEKWVEGVPFLSPNKDRCILIQAVAVHPDYLHNELNVYYSEWIPVDPKTICQYTGITDKNGAMIFEHDIIKFKEIKTDIQYYEVDFTPENFIELIKKSKKCEVIGNVYDKYNL